MSPAKRITGHAIGLSCRLHAPRCTAQNDSDSAVGPAHLRSLELNAMRLEEIKSELLRDGTLGGLWPGQVV
eukprot:scaffold2195_cov430-Prasinococcus_capsulatus_cf.AAC.9